MELSTTDPAGAKDFYGSLFGWEAEDNPIPRTQVVASSMLKLRGESAAACTSR